MKKPAKKPDPYANRTLREQLYLEAHAMAEYALSTGHKVPSSVIRTLDEVEPTVTATDQPPPLSEKHIDALLQAHNTLSRIVDPAMPRTILLLDMEQEAGGLWRFLGPISLIRQMMVAALISLLLFIVLGLSPNVNQDGGNILSSDGLPLLQNLLFFLAAAGLGASFHGLYKANSYITAGTFDPTYHASYWIRFFLGLIAGLFLSVLISEKAFNTSGGTNGLLEEGIVRPLLAMLGGFSADLGYTILNRLVETTESLFRGSAKHLVDTRVQQEKLEMDSQVGQQQLRLASELLQIQGLMATGEAPESARRRLDKLVTELLPAASSPSAEADDELSAKTA